MEEAKTTKFSLLEQLPTELQQNVLGHIDDVYSLRSAASTCRIIYSAFKGAENCVTASVLVRQISPSLIPDVVTRLESTNVRAFDYQGISRFMTKHYRSDRSAEQRKWDLRSALLAAKFHTYVDKLTRRFVSMAGSNFPNRALAPTRDNLSSEESNRIQRTLYRFEVFCNLFRVDFSTQDILADDEWDSERTKDEFLSKFAPWENEQLACVHAWLYCEVYPIIEEFAKHDVEWGSRKIDWSDKTLSGDVSRCVFGFLGRGLRHVSRLLDDEQYDSCAKYLLPQPPWRRSFLLDAFDRFNGEERESLPRSNLGEFEEEPLLENFTSEEEQNFIQPQLSNDTDPGPERIWREVHRSNTPWQFVNYLGHRDLRRWGYVMWDHDRNEPLWVFMEDPEFAFMWQCNGMYSPELVDRWLAFEQEDDAPIDGSLQESFEARKKIFDAGGRGWWSKDDQSRIKWLSREIPPPRSRSSRFRRKM